MDPDNGLVSYAGALVIDSSVAINITATGAAEEIVRALPNTIFVEQTVIDELDVNAARSATGAAATDDAVNVGCSVATEAGFVNKARLIKASASSEPAMLAVNRSAGRVDGSSTNAASGN